MKLIIYATHSFGTYETLIQHPDVICLGFGTKWQGFIHKSKVISEYLEQLPDDEIVAVIDGFDTYIKQTEGLEDAFVKQNCRVLASLNVSVRFPTFVAKRIFSECTPNRTVNSGMMMGYVNEMRQVYHHIRNGPSEDDQRNLNLACTQLPYLKIDTQCIIFQNCRTITDVQQSTAYICQMPGTLSVQRVLRGLREYSNYFIPEILLLLYLLFCYHVVYGPKK